MPNKTTHRRAQTAKRQGKSPSTQAGAYVQEEMHKINKKGTKGVKFRKQAVAIGLYKARRDGVKVPQKKRATIRARSSTSRASEHP